MIAIDNTLLSRIGRPQLCSISLDRKQLARTAFGRLLAGIAGQPDPGGHRTIPTAFIRRPSVIQCPRSAAKAREEEKYA